MPILFLYAVVIVVGALVGVIVNAVAGRRLVNPGLSAGVLSAGVAVWTATIAMASISAHPGLTPEAQGEVFGELVGGPALFAFVACFIIYRKSARSVTDSANAAGNRRNRR